MTMRRMIKPPMMTLLLAGSVVAGCSARMDHLGREPSFSEMSTSPVSLARNPTDRLDAGVLADNRRASLVEPAGIRARNRPNGSAAIGGQAGLGASSGSLWSSDPHSLFGDRRAKTVGDILTVVIEIDDQAEISNATSRARAGEESMAASAVFGMEQLASKLLPGQGLDPGLATTSSSTASGQGQVSRNEAISLKVAARVMDVLPTGHLVITGRQEVRVNFELRDLQVMGLIRPEDITRNNDITYDKMAEARISYGGRGHISDMQQARYGQQVLDMISPF